MILFESPSFPSVSRLHISTVSSPMLYSLNFYYILNQLIVIIIYAICLTVFLMIVCADGSVSLSTLIDGQCLAASRAGTLKCEPLWSASLSTFSFISFDSLNISLSSGLLFILFERNGLFPPLPFPGMFFSL